MSLLLVVFRSLFISSLRQLLRWFPSFVVISLCWYRFLCLVFDVFMFVVRALFH